jgi:hypothetical protein
MTVPNPHPDPTLPRRWVRPDHVLLQRVQDAWVVLNLRTELYHGMNPMAVHMWEVLLESASLEGAVERLAEEYDVARDRLEADLRTLFTQLREQGLLEDAPEAG